MFYAQRNDVTPQTDDRGETMSRKIRYPVQRLGGVKLK